MFTNNMTDLINKIERRLGLLMLKLPETIDKNTWAEKVIIPDTLLTFSRYYPQKIKYDITPGHPRKDGYIYIDEQFVDNHKILGIKDIDWTAFRYEQNPYQGELGFNTMDYMSVSAGFGFEDIAEVSMRADFNSLFSTAIYPQFEPPNRFRLEGLANSDLTRSLPFFTIEIFVVHEEDLTTISPTMMEIFEDLAISDVAGYLYHSLKYIDELDTAFASLNLRLEYLEQKAGERNDILEKIKDSYVSASNQNQAMMMVI